MGRHHFDIPLFEPKKNSAAMGMDSTPPRHPTIDELRYNSIIIIAPTTKQQQ